MTIIFATSACSKKTYKKIFELRNKKILDPAQKFFEQLFTGIAKNNEEVISISARPVSASSSSKFYFSGYEEIESGVKYIYPFFLNGKISRFLSVFLTSFLTVFKLLWQHPRRNDTVVVCDPLNLQVSMAARLAAKFWSIKSVAVVTDIPLWATEMKQHNYSKIRHFFQKKYESLCMKELVAFDGYINLTKFMNSIANPNNKPNVVIEGSVDIDFFQKKEPAEKSKKIVMYAGGVYEKYGLKILVDGFLQANVENAELHIYGTGSYVEKMKLIAQNHPNVKYMGVALNTDLPSIEKKATLLVNPRFSDEEYTKFSFPSKTLEYMMSGTPVLSTCLKGIPEEYEDYIFWVEKENVNGFADKIKEVLGIDEKFLHEFGLKSQRFVCDEKNNVFQGLRIITFVKSVLE